MYDSEKYLVSTDTYELKMSSNAGCMDGILKSFDLKMHALNKEKVNQYIQF